MVSLTKAMNDDMWQFSKFAVQSSRAEGFSGRLWLLLPKQNRVLFDLQIESLIALVFSSDTIRWFQPSNWRMHIFQTTKTKLFPTFEIDQRFLSGKMFVRRVHLFSSKVWVDHCKTMSKQCIVDCVLWLFTAAQV